MTAEWEYIAYLFPIVTSHLPSELQRCLLTALVLLCFPAIFVVDVSARGFSYLKLVFFWKIRDVFPLSEVTFSVSILPIIRKRVILQFPNFQQD